MYLLKIITSGGGWPGYVSIVEYPGGMGEAEGLPMVPQDVCIGIVG
jgi:hypothetical protein